MQWKSRVYTCLVLKLWKPDLLAKDPTPCRACSPHAWRYVSPSAMHGKRIRSDVQGPTLTMRIHSYSLMRDVAAAQQKPRLPESLWKTSPLVVMNNFSGQEHLKLATVLFQNLFPAINVQAVKLAACQVRHRSDAVRWFGVPA